MRRCFSLAATLAFALAAPAANAAPVDWQCDPLLAEDDVCDCGCGVADPVCEDDGLLNCEESHCDVDREFPSPLDPSQCTNLQDLLDSIFNFDLSSIDIPEEHLCLDAFIDAGDGCDCGCGVVDPDCASADAAACDFDACEAFGLELVVDDITQCTFPEGFGLFDLLGLSGDLCGDDDDDDDGDEDDGGSDDGSDVGDDAGVGSDDSDDAGSVDDGDEADAGGPDASDVDGGLAGDATEPDVTEPDVTEPDSETNEDADGGPGDEITFAQGQGTQNPASDDDDAAPQDFPGVASCANSGVDSSVFALAMLSGLAFSRRRRRRSLQG